MSPTRIPGLPQLARLLTLVLALCTVLAVFAPGSHAAPTAAPTAPAGTGTLAPQPAAGTSPYTGEADRGTPVPARNRAPFNAPLDAVASAQSLGLNTSTIGRAPSAGSAAKSLGSAAPSAAAAAEAACNVSDFTSRTGDALVQQVKAATSDCVNQLFNLTGNDAYWAFREAQMVSVADALRSSASVYPGDNSTSVAQLVLFLRAGYFVQWYHASDVGTYGTALQNSIRGALDSFFNSARSRDLTAANAAILGETVTLIDSAQENSRYLPVIKRLLTDYNPATHNGVKGMAGAVNNVFSVLFRGHQLAGFPAAVAADPSLLDTLYNFAAVNGSLYGTDFGYLPYNATRELGRFVQYTALQPKVRPLLKGLAQQSSPSGRTAYQWAAVAEMATEYDAANSAYYGTTDAAARLRTGLLATNFTCSSSIRIIAQQATSDNLNAACRSLTSQDAYFHTVAKDNGAVADDRNTTIEVVVFDSPFDYQVFAASIYGINTDNGGMYLEGKPNAAGNQPRFLAYEAPFAKPAFEVWNLNHEYTHYLDGRFDMYGDFDAGVTTPTIWWIEGFAEYVSYSYRKVNYDAAISAAGLHTYKLSTLFDTTYENTNTERTYRWGYLAVRYMLEQHRNDVDAVLAKYRTGDWNGARAVLKTTIGTRYDADFDTWLTACAAGACANTTPPANRPPTAAFTASVNGSSVNLTDLSTDPDGTVVGRTWSFGDGTGSTAANPYKTYQSPGTYTVTLTVVDDKGAKATTSRSLVITAASECANPDVRVLDRNCARSNVSATTGNYAHFYLYVPAGTQNITVSTSGGTGNADLYYDWGSWATKNSYVTRSAKAGNTESLTITNPPTGYVYFSLLAEEGFNGVTVTSRY
ncbi:collagenase [Kitasatospora purpeofusca]|uniref:collagenase n=1 Tax=Kitasatospora purpeofusca TaxID=67352 RepID=UPI000A6A32FF|nr:collagenase [Kitasatospora purpeofusca]